MRIVLLGLAMTLAAMPPGAAVPVVGDAPGSFTAMDIRFLPRTLADFGEQQAHVLAFTSIEDEASREVLAGLTALEAALRDEAVFVASVDVGNTQPVREVAADAAARRAGYHVLKDSTGKAAEAFGVTGVPTVVLLDSQGRIAYRGGWDAAEARVRALLGGDGAVPAAESAEGTTPFPMREVPEADEPVTFAAHIAPIMHQHCYACHRPGEAGPFTLGTYNQVATRAEMIAEVVLEERMPPWYASSKYGEWHNDRSMSQEERDLIVQWIRGGKQQGNLDEAPAPPPARESEWEIGDPDLIIDAPEPFTVPASGIVPYQYVTLPYQFPEDTWVTGIEILPSVPAVVHHANLAYSAPGEGYRERFNFLTGRVPGNGPADLISPLGLLIEKGAYLTLQIHYVTIGQEVTDRIRVGIRYADGPVLKRVYHKRIRPERIDIPPFHPAAPIDAQDSLPVNATVLALFTHMHVRGRDMAFSAQYPDGRTEQLLSIPNFSFDWQLVYEFMPGEVIMPKGTVIRTVSHYDNSPFNPYNPDPSDHVTYGEQTHEEMNDAYIFYVDNDESLDIVVDKRTGTAINQSLARAE